MTADFPKYAEDNGGATATTIREAATEPSSHTETINALVTDLSNDRTNVQSAIEGDVADIASANPEAAGATAQRVARNGYYAIGLINQFADAVEAYDETVDTLNAELRENTSARVTAQDEDDDEEGGDEGDLSYGDIKAEEKAKLQGRFNTAKTALEQAETTAVSGFQGGAPTEAEAKELMLAGYLPLASAALWPNLNLSPQESYQAYQAAVRTGTMPNAAQMTEDERQDWMEQNPGLVEQWMEIENPDDAMRAAIIALTLPRVSSADGEDDADAVLRSLDEDYSSGPAGFLASMENVQDVNNGLALLAPWAAKLGVDLATNPSVTNAQGYLEKFVAGTYDKQGKIQDYIRDKHQWTTSYTVSDGTHYMYHEDDGFSDGEQDNMFKAYANAILNTSQEDFGGSYDSLPENLREDAEQTFSSKMEASIGGAYWTFDDAGDFQDLAELMTKGDAVPGDDLAKQMASSAVTSTANAEDFWANQPGGHRQEPWNTGLTADILDMTSRNRDATADLVIGDDVPDNYRSDFNATILDQPWDLENGDEAKAAKMYSWIHDDANLVDDPNTHDDDAAVAAAAERADRAFDKLSQDITSVEGGNFQNLMGEEGESAAYRNTLITREIADAFSDHLDEFASESGTDGANGSPLSEGDRVRLMTYIASDHVGDADTDQPSAFDYDRGAGRMAAYVAAYQQDAISRWAENPTTEDVFVLGDKNGRLQGLLDAALVNEAQDRGYDQDAMERERVRNMKIASGIAASLAGKIPGAGEILGPAAGVGNTLLANLLTAEHMPAPDAEQLPDWQADGANVATHNTLWMVDALVESGELQEDDLPPSLRNPEGTSNANIQGAATELLTDYFRDHPPRSESTYTAFTTELHNTYKGFNDHYKLDKVDDNHKKDFLTEDGWGRP